MSTIEARALEQEVMPEAREKAEIAEKERVAPLQEQYNLVNENTVRLVDNEGRLIPRAQATFELVTKENYGRMVDVDIKEEELPVAEETGGEVVAEPESFEKREQRLDDSAVDGALTLLFVRYFNETSSHILKAKEFYKDALGNPATFNGDTYILAYSGAEKMKDLLRQGDRTSPTGMPIIFSDYTTDNRLNLADAGGFSFTITCGEGDKKIEKKIYFLYGEEKATAEKRDNPNEFEKLSQEDQKLGKDIMEAARLHLGNAGAMREEAAKFLAEKSIKVSPELRAFFVESDWFPNEQEVEEAK